MSKPTWCLCQRPTCRGWQEYVAQHKRLHGQAPTELDVRTDRIVMAGEIDRDLADLACELEGDHIWRAPELEPYAVDQAAADQCHRCGCLRHDPAPAGHPDMVQTDDRTEEIFAAIAAAETGAAS